MGGLYIHVPFCKKKCRYCDFYSVTDDSAMPAYIQALKREMQIREWDAGPFDTVFFGGGTPSVLPPGRVAEILERASLIYGIAPDAEVTLEANPGTVSQSDLEAFRSAGVNRISLGVQSLDDQTLQFLGRIHSAFEARLALDWAMEAGFDSVGCDLIYGVPGQTKKSWTKDLEGVLAYGPDHLSCYMLTIEESTPLGLMLERGEFSPMDEGRVGELFLHTSDFLENEGFLHYEISNFARGREKTCRHNLHYWNHAPYLGLGPAAHSYSGETRQWNISDLDQYLELIQAGNSAVEEEESLTTSQHMLEWLYVGLRQAKGIEARDFLQRFGKGFLEIFGPDWKRLQDEGLAKDSSQSFALTKKGMLFSDGVCQLLANCLE
ncbi:oxygen-independent coproporphyrinogen-3 oxidase [Desulfatibacillum alkenivorans DSM 16219]|jgi:oxygen-independent coproporphyrinogen-3 oxidase|uniref:Heme chaperone HemW n=1 Tax=Desulfatibacillum alkenivorans DSM 16219 TaxID=1121393 RepID=A0A1M6PXB6_9BACT|nr:radical SAM family heme chaperone HemW [Desulfatibacillum alkenivorans]SHK12613.1 oxygen-independent coproporphyrinogen-3 oxidase [Desulfatibacillum alkenivorans DSM 16219]